MPKILLISLGSRGDVEPFLAYGEELLQDQTNEVAFCLSEQFRDIAAEVSSTFFPMDKAFLDLFDKPELKQIMGQVGSGWSRIFKLLKLAGQTKAIQKQLIVDQAKAVEEFQPDQIIFHVKCMYPLIWALSGDEPRGRASTAISMTTRTKVKMLLLMPCLVHPVKHEPHIGFGKPRSEWWNLFTYKIADYAMIRQSILNFGKSFMKERGIRLKYKEIKHFIQHELQVEYSISEDLFPRPDYWPQQAQISRFRERNRQAPYDPPQELAHFLDKYPRPLYIGFGSMVNGQPAQVGADILSVCEELNQPVIINSSWGGIELPEDLPEWVYPTSNIPFDFLFPKISAAIHHGGSGTTHSAFQAGVPQMIIPHIADQFFWARTVVRQEAGVEGFRIKDWSREKLLDGIRRLGI